MNKKIAAYIYNGLKLLVSLIAILFVGWKIYTAGASIWEPFHALTAYKYQLLVFAIVLMPVNQGIGAYKWLLLMRRFYPTLTYPTAIAAILAGNTMGIFTPNRVGEYAGRVLHLPEGFRWEAGTLTLLEGVFQTLIALWTGVLSALFLTQYFLPQITQLLSIDAHQLNIVLGILLLVTFLITLMVHFPRIWLSPIMQRFSFPRLDPIIRALTETNASLLFRVFMLSVMRYVVFSFQYVILLWVFGYTLETYLAFAMIWVVYLIKSIIPTVSLSELGIRESVAIAVMGAFGVSVPTATSATFILYLLNIALPALIGLFFLKKNK